MKALDRADRKGQNAKTSRNAQYSPPLEDVDMIVNEEGADDYITEEEIVKGYPGTFNLGGQLYSAY